MDGWIHRMKYRKKEEEGRKEGREGCREGGRDREQFSLGKAAALVWFGSALKNQ